MWTNDIVDAEMDEKHYAYLPKLLMHEFGHTLGIPDLHNPDLVDNPAQYEGLLMYYGLHDFKEPVTEPAPGDIDILGHLYQE